MSKQASVPPIPEGYNAVSVWVVGNNTVKLLDFTKKAFGAEQIACMPNPDGSIAHAEFKINDTIILAFDAKPGWAVTPAFLRLYVDDAEATFKSAIDAGAMPVTKVTKLAFGDQVGRVCDPLGNIWWIQERLEEVKDQNELMERLQEPSAMTAMQYVESSLNDFMKEKHAAQ